jgi:ribonuclease HI
VDRAASERQDLAALLEALARELHRERWPSLRELNLSFRQLAERLERAALCLDPGRAAPEPAPAAPAAPPSAETVASGRDASSLVLYSDGGSRGNPGPAGAGAVLCDPNGEALLRLKRFLGRATNNEAEYQALLMGLEAARDQGAHELDIRLDSELIVKQLKGQYKVKSPHLKPLFQRARELLRGFDRVSIMHIRRELNSEADRLANQAMDQGA